MEESKYLQFKAMSTECKKLDHLVSQLSNDLYDLRHENAQRIEKVLVSSIDTNIPVPIFIPMIDWAQSRCAFEIMALQKFKQSSLNNNDQSQLSNEDKQRIEELQQRKEKLLIENMNLKQELEVLKNQAEKEKLSLQTYFENLNTNQ